MIVYEFSRHNRQTLYGYGTSSDALRYLQWLDRHRGGNWYVIAFSAAKAEIGSQAFNLCDALVAIGDDDSDDSGLNH